MEVSHGQGADRQGVQVTGLARVTPACRPPRVAVSACLVRQRLIRGRPRQQFARLKLARDARRRRCRCPALALSLPHRRRTTRSSSGTRISTHLTLEQGTSRAQGNTTGDQPHACSPEVAVVGKAVPRTASEVGGGTGRGRGRKKHDYVTETRPS